jgi:predicted N-formylglutamate amidohydrolase
MSETNTNPIKDHVSTQDPVGSSCVVLVCEHASHYIPDVYQGLGLAEADRQSHAAWDPGALGVATSLAKFLDAGLVASGVSRLVYDCNRPPESPGAMPARSEVIDVPGNHNLSQLEKDTRTNEVYYPFRNAVARMVAATHAPVLITIHSFTPLYHGKPRSVEIGILHDSDTRLADAMLDTVDGHTSLDVQRNEPYGPEHGVTHTLKEHAISAGHPNVMIEVRNDLIVTPTQQAEMAAMLGAWIADACAQLPLKGDIQCRA